jgi:ferredoxin
VEKKKTTCSPRPSDERLEPGKVTIYLMGKAYQVPASLTIMRAMEETGYQFVRGAGCRGGFCGACATVFRTADTYKLKVGLACQTVIQDGMYLAQLPFYPANKATYDLAGFGVQRSGTGARPPDPQSLGPVLVQLYPEVMRCISCNSCTKICPQDIKVMDYVNAAIRGDIAKCSDLSFNCVACGLCATRCPAEISQYHVGMLARRLHGAYILKRAPHTKQMTADIAAGRFDAELDTLAKASTDDLKARYAKREMEK